MTRPILLNGVTRTERNLLIGQVTEQLGKVGGWVEDVYFFSNIAANLKCRVPGPALPILATSLAGLAINFGHDLDLLVEAIATTDEQPVAIQLTFAHDEPDLRRTIPAVPG